VLGRFLECGDLHHGFARIRCGSCRHDLLLAFSYKTRHFCPSLGLDSRENAASFLLGLRISRHSHRHKSFVIETRPPEYEYPPKSQSLLAASIQGIDQVRAPGTLEDAGTPFVP
jgi:hypothetical protein